MENIPSSNNKEKVTRATPKIRLELFRHDDRAENAHPGLQNIDQNQKIPLSIQGRIHSAQEGLSNNPQPETALAYGSPRERSLETALRQMLSEQPELEEKSFDEIKESVTNGKIKKYLTTPLLDYNFESNEKYREAIDEHYFNKKDMVSFLYHDSDNLAKELGDDTLTTYSRQASNVAKLINKYVNILPHWKQLAGESDKYTNFQNELQRFMGSHGGILESFLMKVIDKKEGRDAVEKFINSLSDKNGFGYSEGYSVIIEDKDNKPAVNITYKDKSWTVDQKFLVEMIQK